MGREQKFRWEKLELGVCYYPEHWSRSLWRDDLRRMKDHGIETVRVAEFAWSIFEPEEGRFSFELFDHFLDLAEEEHMKVIFGTPTAVPPVWLTEKYPEVLNSRKDGVLFRHGMRRHYNYNSKTLHRLASQIVEKVAGHYGSRPCIVGWQIDNELNCEIDEFYSESDNLEFRNYVKDKYRTLDRLNEAWGNVFWNQTCNDWQQVFLPRPTINDMVNPHLMLDYKRFISESAIRFCKMQSDILHKYVKKGDFVTTNGMFGNLDNHRMMDTCLDVYTYDSYPNFAYCLNENPKENQTLNDRKWSRNLAEVRSICPHFGIMEQQSGANGWNTRKGAPAPKPGQMMLWAMQSIMHGADYVSFFRWRTATIGTEMYWHGILDYDNCDNRKLAEVKQIHKRIQAIEDIAGAEYEAGFALVRDYDNRFDSEVDMWHGRISDSSETEIFVGSQLSHTPMDVVYLGDNSDVEELKKYRLLIYPHGEILKENTCRILEEYVRQGGCLVIGARTGQKDEDGHCVMQRMPGLLTSIAQSAVEEFTFIGPDDDGTRMKWDTEYVETGIFNDILMPTGPDAKVLAVYCSSYYEGKPALIETNAGAGKILHFGGTFTRENVKAFFRYAGILETFSHVIELPEECEIGVRKKNGEEYVFVLNYSKKKQRITLKDELTDVDLRETAKGAITLEPYETKVYVRSI